MIGVEHQMQSQEAKGLASELQLDVALEKVATLERGLEKAHAQIAAFAAERERMIMEADVAELHAKLQWRIDTKTATSQTTLTGEQIDEIKQQIKELKAAPSSPILLPSFAAMPSPLTPDKEAMLSPLSPDQEASAMGSNTQQQDNYHHLQQYLEHQCLERQEEVLLQLRLQEPLKVSMVVSEGAQPGTDSQYAVPDGQELRLTIPDGAPPSSLMTITQDPFTKQWKCMAWAFARQSTADFQQVPVPEEVAEDFLKELKKREGSGVFWLLEGSPPAVRANKRCMLAAVKERGQALYAAGYSLKMDKDVVLAAVTNDGRALQHAADSLKMDKDVVLAAVINQGHALKYAAGTLQTDTEMVQVAVRFFLKELETTEGISVYYLLADSPPAVQADKECVLAAVQKCGRALEHASDVLKWDPEVVMVALATYGDADKFVDINAPYWSIKDTVLSLVKLNGTALQYAADSLKADKQMVLAAVTSNGAALEFASDDLRADEEVVMVAVRKHGPSLKFAHGGLNQNPVFLRAASSLWDATLDMQFSGPEQAERLQAQVQVSAVVEEHEQKIKEVEAAELQGELTLRNDTKMGTSQTKLTGEQIDEIKQHIEQLKAGALLLVSTSRSAKTQTAVYDSGGRAQGPWA